MNAEALLAIADMLENDLTDEVFDMHVWKSTCGTIGCAINLDLIPGLKLKRLDGDDFDPFLPLHLESGAIAIPAVAKALDLSHSLAAGLFLPGSYARPTRSTVAARIRNLVG